MAAMPSPADIDREKAEVFQHDDEESNKVPSPEPKFDKHGLPLVPQPSDHEDDPLNWSPKLKLAVLLQVSLLSLVGPMAAAVANPALVALGAAFNITAVQASYELAVYILFSGVGPLFIIPFSHIYGRRPIYLGGNLIAALANLGAGHCATWGGVMATRALSGLGAGSVVALGAATTCDLYFLHERGFFMGIFTVFLTNGPHLAPLVGGFTAQHLGWRYCFTIPAYAQLVLFVVTLFCLPETLYSREELVVAVTTAPGNGGSQQQEGRGSSAATGDSHHHDNNSYWDLILFRPKHMQPHNRKLTLADFARPFTMLRYLCVLLPALYYMVAFSYGSVLFAATGSVVFRQLYHLDLGRTGLMLSLPLLVGSVLGEAHAGWLVDWLLYRSHARGLDGGRHHHQRPPEPRLDALWLALLLPVGTVVQGVCISHAGAARGWVGNAFGMGIANFGLQVATTVVYAYTTDCYKPQSPEISSLLNLFRSVFSAFVSFYAIPLGEKIQFQYAWLVFAMLAVVFMLPVGMLRWYGETIRSKSWQRPPTFQQ